MDKGKFNQQIEDLRQLSNRETEGTKVLSGSQPSKVFQTKRDILQTDLLAETARIIDDFNESTKKYSRILIGLTVAVVVLTLALVWLTSKLVT